ncbi:MAG: YeeE/YedE family protein [Caldilineaceae bacterium]|nr:YeeE/YedE family protein [Caldilineaceae bacterium]
MTALVIVVAWPLARIGGSNYTYGTSGVPTAIYTWLVDGIAPPIWIPLSLVSLVPGALVAAWLAGTLWVRGDSLARYGQLAAGGLLMGVGAAISGGCNLGHSLVGVPLLSLGSITTTLSMALGVFIAHRIWQARLASTTNLSVAKSAA